MSKPIFELSTPFSLFNGAVVLDCTETGLTFGLLDMGDDALKERLQKAADSFFGEAGGTCAFEAISREAFERAVSRQYGKQSDTAVRASDATAAEKPTENEMRAAVLLLDSLLEDARTRGATDIHIEENRVRFRIHGVLQTVCDLVPARSRELTRRIKMLARLNVLEHKTAQDGQFSFGGDQTVFVRVSCMPAVSADGDGFGESVVLRLLDPRRVPFDFSALGFSPAQCAALTGFSSLANGLVLLCGATGAGKSTTAAALLTSIAKTGERKIITLEEPPEYVLSGATQIAIDAQFGMDFDRALRFVFRQDPDVLFIGEIRDTQTAETAVQAAMTGHLVFATMHTGGFYETLLRLQQLGVDAKQTAAVLRGIIVQQLEHVDGNVRLQAGVLRLQEDISWSLVGASDAEETQRRIQGAII